MDIQLGELHQDTFAGVNYQLDAAGTAQSAGDITEQVFARLGRDSPEERRALMEAAEIHSPGSLAKFKAAVVPLRMRRTRYQVEHSGMMSLWIKVTA